MGQNLGGSGRRCSCFTTEMSHSTISTAHQRMAGSQETHPCFLERRTDVGRQCHGGRVKPARPQASLLSVGAAAQLGSALVGAPSPRQDACLELVPAFRRALQPCKRPMDANYSHQSNHSHQSCCGVSSRRRQHCRSCNLARCITVPSTRPLEAIASPTAIGQRRVQLTFSSHHDGGCGHMLRQEPV